LTLEFRAVLSVSVPPNRKTNQQIRNKILMLRRDLSKLLIIAFCVASMFSDAAAQANTRASDRPNVVLILMDDLGYGDIGSYGVKDARTPNLDRLAREGVRLTDAYANGPSCSPTRAGLISGQYQQRYGIEWPLGSVAGDSARGLPATGATLPTLLKKNGYATGLVGKWHLGWKPEFGPNAHGFDEFFGFLSGAVGYYTHRQNDDKPDLYENTKSVEVPGYLTDEITRRAVGFVDRHSTHPFFLEVAYNAVHWPFNVPDLPASARQDVPTPAAAGDPRLYQRPTAIVPATRSDYVRMLERADEGVGQILAALERRGLTRNTLVIFTSDNGGEWLSRNAPLTNRKFTLWEGGIRVPLILRWPGQLPANRTSAQVAVTMDLTASILAATGAAIPATYKLDGLDLLPTLSGRSPVVERQLFWRTQRPHEQRAIRSGRWKLLQDGRNFYLFDVSEDPGERHDLTAAHPELVRKLNAAVDEWEKDIATQRRVTRSPLIPSKRSVTNVAADKHFSDAASPQR
jgi:arylsulfatase A-like enzyme